jgi:hypothetical protein
MEKPIDAITEVKIGRPTKWKPEFPNLILEYFETKADNGELPMLSEFTRKVMGVSEQTALRWLQDDDTTLSDEEKEAFSESYKKAKEIQKEVLIRQGLKSKFNPVMAIFTAKNMTDMRDVVESKHTGTVTHGFVALPPLVDTPVQVEAKAVNNTITDK